MSAGVDGITTLRPGMWASSASRLWECWLPDERPAPNWVRTVSAICGGAAGHERQLRRLVEQLVEAHADEVEVHQLDDRPHPGHRRADAEAHDRGLRDRRVAHPVAEPVAQAAGEAEDVAAVADVDAGDEHPLVGGQLGLERVVDGVHRAEHRRVVGRAAAARGASGRGPGDEVEQRRRRRAGQRPGGLDGVVELLRPPTPRARAIASSPTPAAAEPGGVDDERVALLPLVAAPRASGSAAGRPRSGRATGRWRPRRSTGPPPVAHRRRPRRAIADGGGHDVVAVDGDVVDAVAGGPALERRGVLGRRPAENSA